MDVKSDITRTFSRKGRVFQSQPKCEETECPEGQGRTVQFPREIWNDIIELRNLYYPKECAVFLVLKCDLENNVYLVEDYILPAQGTTHSTVKIHDTGPENTIGHLHSHGTFHAFFSSTDRAHFNYDVHITVGKNCGTIDHAQIIEDVSVVCMTRTKTSCGRIIQRYATVILEEPKIVKVEIESDMVSPLDTVDYSVPVTVVRSVAVVGNVVPKHEIVNGTTHKHEVVKPEKTAFMLSLRRSICKTVNG